MSPKITAPYVHGIVQDHLTKHQDVYEIKLNKHDKTLYGEDGGDGITSDVREIVKGFDGLKKLGYGVIAALIIDIVTRYI